MNTSETSTELTTSGLALFGQVAMILLFVIALILICAWLFKRLGGQHQGAGGFCKIVGSVAVGQRERVVIVSVGDTWLVLGVGQGNVRKLHEMPAQQTPETAEASSFASRFQSAFKQQLKGGQ